MAAGDLNADGKAEVVAGPGRSGGPHVRAFNGADGTLFREFMASSVNDTKAARVAVTDADADGQLDIAVGSGVGQTPAVRLFNPRTQVLIRSFSRVRPGIPRRRGHRRRLRDAICSDGHEESVRPRGRRCALGLTLAAPAVRERTGLRRKTPAGA